MNGVAPARPPRRRPSPAAAAALFVTGGIVLLLVPELLAKFAAGEGTDITDFVGDIVFLGLGSAAVWYLAARIEAAFARETAAREAVEHRERVLADVIDLVPTAVLLLADADEPTVAHANPAADRLLDVPPSADRARPLAELLPVDPATLEAIGGALAARARWSGERAVATATGRNVPLALALTAVASAGGIRAVLVAQDRTELRYAERESERLAVELEGFVETAPVGFVTVGADGRVAAWNAAAGRILGWHAHEMVGGRLPPELGAVVAQSLAAGAGLPTSPRTAVRAAPLEVSLKRADGRPVTVRLTATTAYGRGHDFFGFTAMFEDVTEARRIAAERDEAEARFRAAVDASPVPLVLLDVEGKVRLWSAAAERLFGWTADEAMGVVFPAVPDDGLAAFFERLQQVMDGEPVADERLRYVGRDGRVIPARFWTAPVRASDGSPVGVMGACREEPDDPVDDDEPARPASGIAPADGVGQATMAPDTDFAPTAPGGPPA